MDVKDSNGTLLLEGDNVHIIKDLKVKGSSITIKRGKVVRGIHLFGSAREVECRTDKVKGLRLETRWLKKA